MGRWAELECGDVTVKSSAAPINLSHVERDRFMLGSIETKIEIVV